MTAAMKKEFRIFTLLEANTLLPEVEKRFLILDGKRKSYADHHDVLFMQELLERAERKGGFSRKEEAQNLEAEFQSLEKSLGDLEADIRALHELGCLVRDLEKGLIDFPGEWNGQRVYFCWRRGDKSIRYYHVAWDDIGNCRELPLAS